MAKDGVGESWKDSVREKEKERERERIRSERQEKSVREKVGCDCVPACGGMLE